MEDIKVDTGLDHSLFQEKNLKRMPVIRLLIIMIIRSLFFHMPIYFRATYLMDPLNH